MPTCKDDLAELQKLLRNMTGRRASVLGRSPLNTARVVCHEDVGESSQNFINNFERQIVPAYHRVN